MEIPSKFLIFSLIVHGLFGAFGEILDSMLNKMATPLGNFYNESIFLHYSIELDSAGIQTCLSLMGNLKLIGSIFAVIFILPKMDSWGRKPIAVYLRTILSGIAAILMITSKFSNSFEFFGLGALAMGAALPLRTGINKLYISE
uniref:Uncharacterized protein n=1 Tax=Panagrolaimus sp. ES5 TaxID=591445 RepID=A0AC34GAB5_9BILA